MDKDLLQTRPQPLGGRALCGWSPPRLPADTPAKRRVDRLLPRTGVPIVVYFAVVVALVSLAPHVPSRPGLVALGAGALGGGTWCAVNFWRCRHAHCLVTGIGWLALGGFALVEALMGRSELAGYEPTVFTGVLAAGFLFELAWRLARGTPAVTRATRRPDPSDRDG